MYSKLQGMIQDRVRIVAVSVIGGIHCRRFHCIFFLPALSVAAFTSWTLDKDQKIEQLFCCPFVQDPLPPGDID